MMNKLFDTNVITRDLMYYCQGVIITHSDREFTFENEYGKIVTESFNGKNGQNISSGNKNVGVEESAVHYSLKGPVSDDTTYKCNHLKFVWDTSRITGMNNSEVTTIIDLMKSQFRINFSTHASREEMDYVLSKLNDIKREVQDS